MGKLFILLSGRGSNFLALHEAIQSGTLQAEIVGVFSNDPKSPGLEKAASLGYSTHGLSHRGMKRREHEMALETILDAENPDLVILAGYMRILTPDFVQKYKGRLINIHPALLPAFPGVHAQGQAWKYGVKLAGCTVHFVDEGVDSGPVILQKVVPVYDNDTEDTLATRILEQEHQAYAEAIGIVLEGGWRIEGRRFIRGQG